VHILCAYYILLFFNCHKIYQVSALLLCLRASFLNVGCAHSQCKVCWNMRKHQYLGHGQAPLRIWQGDSLLSHAKTISLACSLYSRAAYSGLLVRAGMQCEWLLAAFQQQCLAVCSWSIWRNQQRFCIEWAAWINLGAAQPVLIVNQFLRLLQNCWR